MGSFALFRSSGRISCSLWGIRFSGRRDIDSLSLSMYTEIMSNFTIREGSPLVEEGKGAMEQIRVENVTKTYTTYGTEVILDKSSRPSRTPSRL